MREDNILLNWIRILVSCFTTIESQNTLMFILDHFDSVATALLERRFAVLSRYLWDSGRSGPLTDSRDVVADDFRLGVGKIPLTQRYY